MDLEFECKGKQTIFPQQIDIWLIPSTTLSPHQLPELRARNSVRPNDAKSVDSLRFPPCEKGERDTYSLYYPNLSRKGR